jgi:RND family efflux transporter MFP subunit
MSHSESPATDVPLPVAGQWWAVLVIPTLVALALASVWYLGWAPRQAHAAILAAETTAQAQAPIRSRVGKPKAGAATANVTLPASVLPSESAAVHARVAGIVARRLVALGDRVVVGQVLVELDAPELGQQVLLAEAQVNERRAGVAQAEAAHHVEQAGLKRAEAFTAGEISPQALDERRGRAAVTAADLLAAQARVAAAEAELARLRLQLDFTHVTAPIAGVVVEREVEIGDPVVPGGGGKPLLRLAQLDQIRIAADVPQSHASGISVGLPVTLQPRGAAAIQATITRTAGALDAASRALHIEIDLPAQVGLLPGAYLQVVFAIPVAKPGLTVPSDALLVGPQGPQVAIVDENGRAKLVSVRIESDNGSELAVSGGLKPSDQVLLNPSSAIEEGRLVKATEPPVRKPAEGAAIPVSATASALSKPPVAATK